MNLTDLTLSFYAIAAKVLFIAYSIHFTGKSITVLKAFFSARQRTLTKFRTSGFLSIKNCLPRIGYMLTVIQNLVSTCYRKDNKLCSCFFIFNW